MKQRSFVAVFGWWTERELLRKHGLSLPESDESERTSEHAGGADALELSDGEPLGLPDSSDVDLFASDAEDDWEAEDLLPTRT